MYLSKTAQCDQQFCSHHQKKPGNLYVIGPKGQGGLACCSPWVAQSRTQLTGQLKNNKIKYSPPPPGGFRTPLLPWEAWLQSLILRTHLSLCLGLPFSPLVLHRAPSSWALPTDLLPAAKASTAQVLPWLSSRELRPSRALGLQVQGRVRTDKSTHHLTPCSSTHPSHHPYTHSSFHPLIFLSIYPFTYPDIQQKHPLC